MGAHAFEGRPRSIRDWIGYLCSSQGRIGRLEYFLTEVGVLSIGTIIAIAIAWLGAGVSDVATRVAPERQETAEVSAFVVFLLCTALILIAGLWILACSTIKRFHDLDMSGWWLLGTIVPILGLVLWAMTLFGGGSPGANRFGTRPGRDAPIQYSYDAAP